MNAQQISLCEQILKALFKYPVSNMFWEYRHDLYSSGSAPPLSFQIIEERLHKGMYKDPESFTNEVRIMLAVAIKDNDNSSLRYGAAKLLLDKYDSILCTLSPSLSPHIVSLQGLEYLFQTVCSDASVVVNPITREGEGAPANEFFKQERSLASNDQLMRDFMLLKEPMLIVRFIGYLYAIKAEAVIFEEKIYLDFNKLNEDEREKASQYLHNLILEASLGTIDPYFQSPKAFPDPVDINLE